MFLQVWSVCCGGGWSERGQEQQEGGQLEGFSNNQEDVNTDQIVIAVTYCGLRGCQEWYSGLFLNYPLNPSNNSKI